MEWDIRPGLTAYDDALDEMAARAEAIHDGTAGERILLVEHPPLYTAGTSAKSADLTDPDRFPVFVAGRGGEYTYHGPGQRVVYPALDLKTRGRDVRAYVAALESWVIAALVTFGIEAFVREGRVGVWTDTPEGEAKIAAIGVRVRRWVTMHGVAVNVAPDLSHYGGIVPCGLTLPVTSMAKLGCEATLADIDSALRTTSPF